MSRTIKIHEFQDDWHGLSHHAIELYVDNMTREQLKLRINRANDSIKQKMKKEVSELMDMVKENVFQYIIVQHEDKK